MYPLDMNRQQWIILVALSDYNYGTFLINATRYVSGIVQSICAGVISFNPQLIPWGKYPYPPHFMDKKNEVYQI